MTLPTFRIETDADPLKTKVFATFPGELEFELTTYTDLVAKDKDSPIVHVRLIGTSNLPIEDSVYLNAGAPRKDAA